MTQSLPYATTQTGFAEQRLWRLAKAALPYAGLFMLITALSILRSETFLSVDNFTIVIKRSSFVIISAVGMTMVIVSGGIDLSVGSIFAFSGVIGALAVLAGVPVPLGISLGILAGAACGLLSGVMITLLRIPPFIATLGMLWAVRGFAEAVTHGGQAQYVPNEGWKWLYSDLGTLHLPVIELDLPLLPVIRMGPTDLPIPVPVVLMVVIVLIFSYIMRRTRLGRYTYAIGSNAEAARLSGVRTPRVLIILYTICGALAGLSGMILAAKLSSGVATEGIGEELTVIAAVVIGGGSLSGGMGTVGGCVIGALLMSFLANGCNLLGIEQHWQKVIAGMIVVAAVALDQWRHRRGT
ncbi:MAG: ABC transporter permease [Phycisphaerae bacterium]|nr:ABC transporter permease [Phycisphaerae bacterium]